MRWFSHRRRTGWRHNCTTHPWQPRNGPVRRCCTLFAASTYHSYAPRGVDSTKRVFCPWWPWPLTLTFKFGRYFCTMHLTAKFHRPTFNRSEVIVLTNKQTDKLTNKQTPLKTTELFIVQCWKHLPRSAVLRRWVK